MNHDTERNEELARQRRKGLIPAFFILGGLIAVLAWVGVRSITTGEATFGGSTRSGSAGGGSPGASKTVRGNAALLSGVGSLVIAAGIAVVLAAVMAHSVLGVNLLAKPPVRIVPAVMLIAGILLMFLPSSCGMSRAPPPAVPTPAGPAAYNP